MSAQEGACVRPRVWAVASFPPRTPGAGHALTAANVEAVVRICRQLDGVALAIGLAAARVPVLGVAGLHDRLHKRLRLLVGRELDTVVQAKAIATAHREESGKVTLTLRGRPEKLTANRLYAHLFKGM